MVLVSDVWDSVWVSFVLTGISILIFGAFYGVQTISLRVLRLKIAAVRVLTQGALFGLPMSVIAIMAGFLTGASREPAVDALVPAALTLLGGLAMYMVGKGRLRGQVVGFAVLVFSINLMVGVSLGSISREKHEAYLESAVYLKRQANTEFQVRLYRKGLGLPVSPIVSGKKAATPTAGTKPARE